MKKITVVIDGPAGSGKSTVSQKLAKKLNYTYLDSGALYRAIALKASRKNVKPRNSKALYLFCKKCVIAFKTIRWKRHVFLDHADVTQKIRTRKISLLASLYSKLPVVRKALLYQQQKLGEHGGIVAEGRDLGTVVFPTAELKFFLVASLEERAKRRYLELKQKLKHVSLKEILKEIQKRDREDSKRALAPLKKAKDAISLDTTRLTIDQVVSHMYKEFRKIGG